MREKRSSSFYWLAALFGLFVLFLYGPMITIFILSFQGPDGGLTFPMNGVSPRPGRDGTDRGAIARGRLCLSQTFSRGGCPVLRGGGEPHRPLDRGFARHRA